MAKYNQKTERIDVLAGSNVVISPEGGGDEWLLSQETKYIYAGIGPCKYPQFNFDPARCYVIESQRNEQLVYYIIYYQTDEFQFDDSKTGTFSLDDFDDYLDHNIEKAMSYGYMYNPPFNKTHINISVQSVLRGERMRIVLGPKSPEEYAESYFKSDVDTLTKPIIDHLSFGSWPYIPRWYFFLLFVQQTTSKWQLKSNI